MAKKLPSDDEIRASLRRGRPNRFFEAFGLLGVIGTTAIGSGLGAYGFVEHQWTLGMMAGSGLIGFIVGVLVFQFIKQLIRMTRKPPPAEDTEQPPEMK